MIRFQVWIEIFPVRGRFAISRGARTEVRVVRLELEEAGVTGRAEAVPYARYGEDPQKVVQQILAMKDFLQCRPDRTKLLEHMPAGAARNAIDCALWDLESRKAGSNAFALAGIHDPRPRRTAFTISLATAEEMHAAAIANREQPLLKIKLGAPGDAERIRAVRDAAPNAELIADANEGWSVEDLTANLAACRAAGFTLVEQPLPAGADACLSEIPAGSLLICADESAHTRRDLPRLTGLYQAVNIKLDKAGGLTEALEMAREARDRGFEIMAGCMLGTSLSMAPATLLAQYADYIDLDGPLLLAADRPSPLSYEAGKVGLPPSSLWGS